MGSVSAFTQEVKAIIWERAHGFCDRCGLPVQYGVCHHRCPRRAGGSSREDLGLPSNGVLLHNSCHDFVESHRKIAAQLGFLVGYGRTPNESPILLWKGWHMLHDDGTATRMDRVPPLSRFEIPAAGGDVGSG
jgi:hypothetical protein